MCGIAGWIGQVRESALVIDALSTSLRHRGPDSRGQQSWEGAALVHRRLSIIDLSPAGHQPISNEDGSVWAVFNGEIYNHHELREDLQRRGHRFRGRSDSEVLPHLYEEWGADLATRLKGMFAFAIYDARKHIMLLARDRFGIKPAFYAEFSGGLAFASEISALRGFPGVDLVIDRQAVADYAALSYIPAPSTLFRGIRCLEPGQTLQASRDGAGVSTTLRRYHLFHIAIDQEVTLDAAVDRVGALLNDAVRAQLESDVPLGGLLSGGIDSSLVSAAAQKSLPHGLKTFNVQMPDPRYDETWAATAVAKHIGSDHKTIPMERRGGSWEEITSLLIHCGQPFADTSVFAVDAISRRMRQEVTVALCGDGGDEGFAGYDFYWKVERIAGWLRWPRAVLAMGAQAARLAARAGMVSPSFPDNLGSYADATDADIVGSLTTWIDPTQHRLLVRDRHLEPVARHFRQEWEHDFGKAADHTDRLAALALEFNIRLALPNDFLFKTDIASMRAGFEVRVPLLDEALIDFALSLPRQLKVRGREGKIPLRRLAAVSLPPEIASKPKQGFAVPVDRWVDDDFGTRLARVLLGPQSVLPEFYDPGVYGPWIEAFARGRQHPHVNRAGLYYRSIMLLAMQLTLAPETAAY